MFWFLLFIVIFQGWPLSKCFKVFAPVFISLDVSTLQRRHCSICSSPWNIWRRHWAALRYSITFIWISFFGWGHFSIFCTSFYCFNSLHTLIYAPKTDIWWTQLNCPSDRRDCSSAGTSTFTDTSRHDERCQHWGPIDGLGFLDWRVSVSGSLLSYMLIRSRQTRWASTWTSSFRRWWHEEHDGS